MSVLTNIFMQAGFVVRLLGLEPSSSQQDGKGREPVSMLAKLILHSFDVPASLRAAVLGVAVLGVAASGTCFSSLPAKTVSVGEARRCPILSALCET